MSKKKVTQKKKTTPPKKANQKKAVSHQRGTQSSTNNIPVIRVSQEFTIEGYVIDTNNLDRIDRAARHALAPDIPDTCTVTISAQHGADRTRIEFNSLQSFHKHTDQSQLDIKSLTLEYANDLAEQLKIEFEVSGTIRVTGFCARNEFQFHVDQLTSELKACDQEYHFFARTLSYSEFPRRISSKLLSLSSLILFTNILFYFYAMNVGVDLDPTILPAGNEYFHEVEIALKTGTDQEKLDVILRGQLLNFSNISRVLRYTRLAIIWSLLALLVLIGAVFSLKMIRRLYPSAFFAFGPGTAKLDKLKRRREILSVGVIVAFVVNILAGTIVAIVSG